MSSKVNRVSQIVEKRPEKKSKNEKENKSMRKEWFMNTDIVINFFGNCSHLTPISCSYSILNLHKNSNYSIEG